MIDKKDVDPNLTAVELLDRAEIASDWGVANEMLARARLKMLCAGNVIKDGPLFSRWEKIYDSWIERLYLTKPCQSAH